MIDWSESEKSTRNCYLLKVKGQMVHCERGVVAFEKNIVKYPSLMQKCQGCEKWEGFNELK
jgi:hypothetical protein